MIAAAISRAGVPIRLTDERWSHIVEEHAELAGMREEVLQAVADAEAVYLGRGGELLATKAIERTTGRTMVAVYRETSSNDGFIITAFMTSQPQRVARRPRRWPQTK